MVTNNKKGLFRCWTSRYATSCWILCLSELIGEERGGLSRLFWLCMSQKEWFLIYIYIYLFRVALNQLKCQSWNKQQEITAFFRILIAFRFDSKKALFVFEGKNSVWFCFHKFCFHSVNGFYSNGSVWRE